MYYALLRKGLLIVILGASLILFFVAPKNFVVESGPVYVSTEHFPISGPGYAWWPKHSLGEALIALNQRSENDRIIMLSGVQRGVFPLPHNTSVQGAEGARIDGHIYISGGVTAYISDFDITGSGPGVRIEEGGKVEVQRMTIRDNEGDGIDGAKGSLIRISDSILLRNRKGVYARRQSDVIVRNSQIAENEQEGIDLRQAGMSIVAENTITKNGESGVEFVIGDTAAELSNNTISENIKSGVVVEYSRLQPALGKIVMRDNRIVNNGRVGVRCVSRTGGTRPYRYFARSVEVGNSVVEGNEEKDFSSVCNFGEPLDPLKLKSSDEV